MKEALWTQVLPADQGKGVKAVYQALLYSYQQPAAVFKQNSKSLYEQSDSSVV